MSLKIGDKIPVFQLPDETGTEFNSSSLVGKPAVIFFYPKDNTFLCTKEACAFRDSFSDFQNMGIVVIGISADSPISHADFKKTHKLPYRLLSDERNEIRNVFGVPNDFLGLLPGRVTYCFSPDGIVVSIIHSSISADKHVKESMLSLIPS